MESPRDREASALTLWLCDRGGVVAVEHILLTFFVPPVTLSWFLQGGTALRVFVSPFWAPKNQLVSRGLFDLVAVGFIAEDDGYLPGAAAKDKYVAPSAKNHCVFREDHYEATFIAYAAIVRDGHLPIAFLQIIFIFRVATRTVRVRFQDAYETSGLRRSQVAAREIFMAEAETVRLRKVPQLRS